MRRLLSVVSVVLAVLPPVAAAAQEPTPDPSASPTPEPSASPSPDPSASPEPSASPSPDPSASPAPDPSAAPTPGPSASPSPDPAPTPGSGTVTRVSGEGRSQTAVAVSQRTFPSGAPTVVIARADAYPDALAGAPLARALGAPLLLSTPEALSEPTAAEVTRLGATSAVLLGGIGALSAQVREDLAAIGVTAVERVSGDSRFATAAAVAERVLALGGPRSAYLVKGADADPARGWADAVAVSALAAARGVPILLTDSNDLPEPTAAALRAGAVTEVVVVGGPGAVGEEVVGQVHAAGATTSRLAGATRYATSAAVAAAAGSAPVKVWVATGRNYPDALAAGPAAAAEGAVLVLVDGHGLNGSPDTRDWLAAQRASIAEAVVVGGTAAVTDATIVQLGQVLSGAAVDPDPMSPELTAEQVEREVHDALVADGVQIAFEVICPVPERIDRGAELLCVLDPEDEGIDDAAALIVFRDATGAYNFTYGTGFPTSGDELVRVHGSGRLCRELAAAGEDYFMAVLYWFAEGEPARMDADGNGIPCETVYDADVVAKYWGLTG